MKKSLALILTVAMLLSSMVFVMPLSASAEQYYANNDTLELRVGGGSGLSIGENGKTVVFNRTEGMAGSSAWSNIQMMGANDDVKDGFSMKITDIKWDADNNNAIAVIYGNTAFMGTHGCENGQGSNFTLLVKRDGSVALWGDGFNSNHIWGKWTSVHVDVAGVLDAGATEFQYDLVPNADKSAFTFYVNGKSIYTYSVADAASRTHSVFYDLDRACNFGFQVLNGNGSSNAGYGSQAYGTLSYRIDKIESAGVAPAYASYPMVIGYRAGGGSGLSVSGNTISLAANSSNAYWSNGQMIVNDDIKDGFTVKISDIVWDSENNTAVALTYSNNATSGFCGACTDGKSSNFTLLVMKDGSVVLWGNGYNTNHPYGKWVEVIAKTTLGRQVTEFTYSLVPNADKTAFTFYVNDTAVYTYDIAAMSSKASHAYSIFKDLNRTCNFGFAVLNGTPNGNGDYGQKITGTLSYNVDSVICKGITPEMSDINLGFRQGGSAGLSINGNKVILNYTSGNTPIWGNGYYLANDDVKDGFSIKVKDIAWDAANNNAVVLTYGNTPNTQNTAGVEGGVGSNFTLMVRKDGTVVLWGNGINYNNIYGKWAAVYKEVSLGYIPTEFTWSLVPSTDLTKFTFYVDDTAIYTYDRIAMASSADYRHSRSIFYDLDVPCNFGFMAMCGTGDSGTGFGKTPAGTLYYAVDDYTASVPAVNGGSINLQYIHGGGTGLSVSGNKVILAQTDASANPAYWSVGQALLADDVKDGFSVTIKDIKWDPDNNNAVAIVYGKHASNMSTVQCETASNFTLIVSKDGSVTLYGNGYNSNHTNGKWTEVCVTKAGVISDGATSFTYKLVPNADKSAFTFYVNDTAIYTYDIAAMSSKASHAYSIFNDLSVRCNFGFQVINGTGSSNAGWGTKPVGTLVYAVDKIESKGTVNANVPTLDFVKGGGEGLSVNGNRVTLNIAEANANAPAYWSVGQVMAGDDYKDGFTVKITDINWDEVNDNAVTIVYGNHTSNMSCVQSNSAPNFTLLVKKDGSIVFWKAFNSNHTVGKWTGAVTNKTLGGTVDSFTYTLAPNTDGSYTFYVNDIAVYTAQAGEANTVFASDKACNFGFMVLNGTGNDGTGWNVKPFGKMAYSVAEISATGTAPEKGKDLEFVKGGGEGLSVSGNRVTLNIAEANANAPAFWSAGQYMAGFDVKSGFEVKISNIVWDRNNDNAVTIVFGNHTSNMSCVQSNTAPNFTLLVRKDGSMVFWKAFNSNHTVGKWTGAVIDKTLGETVTEFTYKMTPNEDGTYTFSVNGVELYTAQAGEANTVFATPDKPCNFGFMVLNGTGNDGTGWNVKPFGKMAYSVAFIKTLGVELTDSTAAADVDNDGAISNADVSLVIRHLSGWNVAGSFDANGDGKINNRDAIYLIQILNGFNLDPIALIAGGKSEYTIIASDINFKATNPALYLKDMFLKKTGIALDVSTDWKLYETSKYEIVVGDTERAGATLTAAEKSAIKNDGFVIKALGSRIWIAGATEEGTKAGIDYFLATYVTGNDVTLPRSLSYVKAGTTVYPVTSMTVAGNDITGYVIAYDESSATSKALAKKFQSFVWDNAGIHLDLTATPNSSAKKVSFELNTLVSQPTFSVKVAGNDLVIYGTNNDTLTKAYDYFVREYLTDTGATIAIADVDYTVSYDKITSLTLAGHDISEYVIVNTRTDLASAKYAASQLQNYLKLATDVNLAIVADTASAPMIQLVLDEAMGENYTLKTSDAGLTITGGVNGMLYGVYAFLEDYIGWNFFPYAVEVLKSEEVVVIDEIDVEYNQYFELRNPHFGAYWNSWVAVQNGVNGDISRQNMIADLGNWVSFAGSHCHTLAELLGQGDSTGESPCITNVLNVYKIKKSVREFLAANPDAEMISVSLNDSGEMCTCDGCTGKDIGGNVSDALMELVNAVAADIAADYPNVKVHTLAYGVSAAAPIKVMPADNVVVQVAASGGSCKNHAYVDQCCENSATFVKNLTDWTAICDNVYIWDYSANFRYYYVIFPNFDVIRENMKLYADLGVKGVYIQGDANNNYAKFENLQAYLYAKLMENPYMSEAEYDNLINLFLECNYGPGWENIRAYLDFLVDSANSQGHWAYSAELFRMYGEMDFVENYDQIDAWFDEALSLADTQGKYNSLMALRVSADYLTLFMTYDYIIENGTADEIAALKAKAGATWDEMYERNVRILDMYPDFADLMEGWPADKYAHPYIWGKGSVGGHDGYRG